MFIIDGYNLLHVILKAEESTGTAADLELCRVLSRYLAQIGTPGVIIFDGAGPPEKSGFEDLKNLEILFAGLGADADSAIEDKISASTAPKRLTVVSSDRRLRRAARARKCASLKSEVFWGNVRRQLSRRKPVSEPAGKRLGLSDSETDKWLDVFGLEQ